ncbi:uncharacterized protein LOC123262109 [Cotesia glomerata]|nr:uncharacterized protein LOC123262109 [Cotesia glomerata]XP_044580086.1 uncharacterized protein LOC123262109 [Cotesia glomerata]
MFLSLFILTTSLQIIIVSGQEISVVRHIDGDIFTVEGSCATACTAVSSGTANPYKRQISQVSDGINSSSLTSSVTTSPVATNTTCVCQCKSELALFREDLNICVSDIHECRVTGFISNAGVVERIPYVFLPQLGQIIYPQAEIQFQGVTAPVCGIAGAQQLGRSGWSEFRNLSSTESPFRLFKDQNKTFIQWIGDVGLRESAEGKLIAVKLVCRDASPNSTNPGVFIPCVAFRVAGSPSRSNIREVSFVSTGPYHQGLSTLEYTAIGISILLLVLIYIASVSLYLHTRKARRKRNARDPELTIPSREAAGLIKNNPLLNRHFESDSNSLHSETSDPVGEEYNPTDPDTGFEKVTSAIIHPHAMFVEHANDSMMGSSSSAIIAERLPEEDVRIVETADTANQFQQQLHHQQFDMSVLPGIQRRKLYFNPAYFDRQLLLAPPPAAIEFILKIREVISIAKHKLTAKRFIPTLTKIPEEDSVSSDKCSTSHKRAASSIRSSITKSRKSQKCTGCPGCLDTRQISTNNGNLPLLNLPDDHLRPVGESRVRAWLEDIKPPSESRRKLDNNNNYHYNGFNKNQLQDNSRVFARSLEYLNDIPRRNTSRNSLTTWKDPPMLRTFQNIALSECDDDQTSQHSVSKRSTKSMFEDTNYDRYCRTRKCTLLQQKINTINEVNQINDKVRKAIENSFIKQMEENAALESQIESKMNERRFSPDGSSEKTNFESLNSLNSYKSPSNSDKSATGSPSMVQVLPDMINELPNSKLQAKKIMDAVIKEMVDVKLDNKMERKLLDIDYEVDSLERTQKRLESNLLNKHLKKQAENQGEVQRKNYYNKLPELVSRNEGYSLVSEVYVNDGYASPANSDDSGPEISYEPEQPGHLTIKVQDSPDNYVKYDESEYEPDTLDRKPMKLKINGDVIYDNKEANNEVYVDSLERPSQILLKSKGSFRDEANLDGTGDENDNRNENGNRNGGNSLTRGYGSLREIYEARLRMAVDSNLMNTNSLNGQPTSSIGKNKKYLTPDLRQARRQRKQNQPDVVPLPPEESEAEGKSLVNGQQENGPKNVLDRRFTDTGNPTAGGCSPVVNGDHVGKKSRREGKRGAKNPGKVEDSGYLSSTDSNGSNKHLLKYEFGSVSETDENESVCDAAESESGAESVDTDSVFFGNFRKLTAGDQSKSYDSGVDFANYIKDKGKDKDSFKSEERYFFNSDSEHESFVTVLPHEGRNSLVL